VKNRARLRRISKASRLLAETDVMRTRLARALGLDERRIGILPPSPSEYVRPRAGSPHGAKTTFLFVSGMDAHKNLWRLPQVAREMVRRGVHDFEFIITVTERSFLSGIDKRDIDRALFESHFRFAGTISPTALQHIYDEAHALVTLSDLESFSNNYMEAWKVGIPIVASDRDFARTICGDSAIYTEPHDVGAVASTFQRLMSGQYPRDQMLRTAASRWRSLPTTQERYSAIWREIDDFDLPRRTVVKGLRRGQQRVGNNG